MKDAEIIKRTLKWCNERRAEKGLNPLDDLPKGRRHNGLSCPCGKACGYYVGAYVYADAEDWRRLASTCEWARMDCAAKATLPLAVREFVHKFDNGGFPQYSETGKPGL